jgi:hypothetical protein
MYVQDFEENMNKQASSSYTYFFKLLFFFFFFFLSLFVSYFSLISDYFHKSWSLKQGIFYISKPEDKCTWEVHLNSDLLTFLLTEQVMDYDNVFLKGFPYSKPAVCSAPYNLPNL